MYAIKRNNKEKYISKQIKRFSEIIECDIKEIGEIEIKLVSYKMQDDEWKHLIREYHYLGHKKIIGKQLKYLIYNRGKTIGAVGWKSGYTKLNARDKYIGWTQEQRRKNLNSVINNNRFLILPWIKVKNLASHVLSRNLKQVVEDWQKRYREKPLIAETYVDPSRFLGTCYRASGWMNVGRTKGFTKIKNRYEYHGKEKEVYIYVIDKTFKTKLDIKPFSKELSKTEKKKENIDMMIGNADYNPELIDWADIDEKMINGMAKELISFHDGFKEVFTRSEQYILGQVYLKGLMSDLERKNVEAIALRYLGKQGVRSLQQFMKNYKWDEDAMLKKIQQEVIKLLGQGNSMVTVDSSENRKKGDKSVGIASQYCGNLGKVENSQSGLFIGYTSDIGYALIERQLYMPKDWFTDEYEDLRKECFVPTDLMFKTKIEIAIERIKAIIEGKIIPFEWIGADATFGSSRFFRDEIDNLDLLYFVHVKSNARVWIEMPKLETYTGRDKEGNPVKKQRLSQDAKKSMKVSDIVIDDWETLKLQEGSKGPLYAKVKMIRVIECRNGLPGKELWLFVRRDPDGTIRYYFSNAPADIDFKEMLRACIMRYPLEQCFKDGKKYLGMDHYEHRSWPAWHRHMTYVFMAVLFLLLLRLKYKKKSLH